MANMTTYLENKLLDHVLRGVNFPAPAGVYVALFTSETSDEGGGTEVSGNGYARQTATFGAPVGGVVKNSAAITFPVATGNWGNITHVAIFDAATDGNMLYHAQVEEPKTIGSGDQYIINVGGLTVTQD